MDADGKFWTAIWGLVALTICTLIVSLAVEDMYAAHKITEMVEAGADPIQARCALYSLTSIDCNLALRAAQ